MTILDFGELSYCLSYQAGKDFFNNYTIKPNTECLDKNCLRWQKDKLEKCQPCFIPKRAEIIEQIEKEHAPDEPEETGGENEWGIEMVMEGDIDTEDHVVSACLRWFADRLIG